MQGNFSKSVHHIIRVSVEVECFAVAHIVQLAVSSFPIIDRIEEVIDLFNVSFEKVSIVFAEGLVTDFEVLFHGFDYAFWFMFRQRLFFSCYHSKDAKEQSADSKKEDDLHWIHLFDCMGNVSDCKERFLFLLEFIVFIYDIVKVLHRFVMVSHGLL